MYINGSIKEFNGIKITATELIIQLNLNGKRFAIEKNGEIMDNKLLTLKDLQKDKWLWYTGKLSKEEIQEKNWDYDPFKGLTILKTDYDKFFGADKDIQKVLEKLEICRVTVSYLQDVVSQLTWRHQTIKNIIEWRKFMAGS